MTGRDSRSQSGMTEMIDRLLEWLPDRAGMTNEVDGLLIGIPDQIGYNGENSGMTEKGFPIAVGNDGGGRESTRRESRSEAEMPRRDY